MDKTDLIGKLVNRKEVAQLPLKLPMVWFLLEIVEADIHGRAKILKIVSYSENKDELREHLLELDPGDKKFIFFFSDPDKECEI